MLKSKKPTKTKTRVTPASARTVKAKPKVRSGREAPVGSSTKKVKPSRASLREERTRVKTKTVKAKPVAKKVSAKVVAKPANTKKVVRTREKERTVNKVRITDPSKLLYKVSLIGRSLVEIDCTLLAVGDNVLIRHRKERSSKMIVESLSSKDVVCIKGNLGEKATVLAYVHTTVKEYDGLVANLPNGFLELTMVNGDTIQFNRYAATAGIEMKVSAMETDVVEETFPERRKSSLAAADEVDTDEDFEDEGSEDESDEEDSEDESTEELAVDESDEEDSEDEDEDELDEEDSEDDSEDESEDDDLDDDLDDDELEDEDDLSEDDED